MSLKANGWNSVWVKTPDIRLKLNLSMMTPFWMEKSYDNMYLNTSKLSIIKKKAYAISNMSTFNGSD
ncbi:MAG TPA: hypothetical protein EYP92_00845 [Candidatus Thioglobus sp.]|nr:hypothetical protein [Candidatus Thioglobus sp.]